MAFKSGFVAIIGKSNAGKSTLMNALVKKKIAIVSPKVQTTRNKIQGIYTDNDAQIVFIDTPGIQKPLHELGNFMNNEAYSSLYGIDAVLLLIDGTRSFNKGDEVIIERLKEIDVPVFLIVNKIDLISIDMFMVRKDVYKDKLPFKKIIGISALNEANLGELITELKAVLPTGPKYYPEESYTDHPETFIMQEIIREKIITLTEEEIPHSCATLIEHLEDGEDGKLYIDALVIVERDSQKAIIIGQKGEMLKKITAYARNDIQKIFATKVKLKIFVKVEPNWRNNRKYLKELGYFKVD